MKKMICVLLALCMVFALSACGGGNTATVRQTASAYLNQSEDVAVEVTVDLSGGWSVEFARGAVYLYDGEITEGKESVAMLITLDQEVYEENLTKSAADTNRTEADGGVYYTDSEGRGVYLLSLEDSAYLMLTAQTQTKAETIAARFALSLQ